MNFTLGVVEGWVVTHDGETIKSGFQSDGEAMKWLHNRHSYSVDHAVKYEGYDIVLVQGGNVKWSYKRDAIGGNPSMGAVEESAVENYVIYPNGLHLWGSKNIGLGEVPPDVIAQKSERFSLEETDIPSQKILKSDVVTVRGDIPEEGLRTIAVAAEEMEAMLSREVKNPGRRHAYKIRIFNNLADFCSHARMCGAVNALSFYDPRSEEMALHFGPQITWDGFETVFAHEFVHSWMDNVYKVTGPLWFAEGMAEYFSRIQWTPSGYVVTGKNNHAVNMLYRAEVLPLREFITLRRDEMYGINFPIYYAQSWALVSMLLNAYPKKVSKLLDRMNLNIWNLEDKYRKYIEDLKAQHS